MNTYRRMLAGLAVGLAVLGFAGGEAAAAPTATATSACTRLFVVAAGFDPAAANTVTVTVESTRQTDTYTFPFADQLSQYVNMNQNEDHTWSVTVSDGESFAGSQAACPTGAVTATPAAMVASAAVPALCEKPGDHSATPCDDPPAEAPGPCDEANLPPGDSCADRVPSGTVPEDCSTQEQPTRKCDEVPAAGRGDLVALRTSVSAAGALVVPAPASTRSVEVLPATGSATLAHVLLAGAVLGVGLALVAATRRRLT